jgi:hypothetical protein
MRGRRGNVQKKLSVYVAIVTLKCRSHNDHQMTMCSRDDMAWECAEHVRKWYVRHGVECDVDQRRVDLADDEATELPF